MKILFCCTGNTCRSPMAEIIMRNLLTKRGIREVEVESCGTSVVVEQSLSANSVSALRLLGIKGEHSHHSRPISRDIADSADYIITMTIGHKRYLANQLGIYDRTYTLDELVGGGDVLDPFGGDEKCYMLIATILESSLISLIDRLGLK